MCRMCRTTLSKNEEIDGRRRNVSTKLRSESIASKHWSASVQLQPSAFEADVVDDAIEPIHFYAYMAIPSLSVCSDEGV